MQLIVAAFRMDAGVERNNDPIESSVIGECLMREPSRKDDELPRDGININMRWLQVSIS